MHGRTSNDMVSTQETENLHQWINTIQRVKGKMRRWGELNTWLSKTGFDPFGLQWGWKLWTDIKTETLKIRTNWKRCYLEDLVAQGDWLIQYWQDKIMVPTLINTDWTLLKKESTQLIRLEDNRNWQQSRKTQNLMEAGRNTRKSIIRSTAIAIFLS